MIISETVGDRRHTYSDAGMKIMQEQTGIVYDDAMDVPSMEYTYIETDEPIEGDELTDTEALNIIMGRNEDEPTDGD